MNDLWLRILVGHLNKNGACSIAKQSTITNHRSIFNYVSAFTPMQIGFVAINKLQYRSECIILNKPKDK